MRIIAIIYFVVNLIIAVNYMRIWTHRNQLNMVREAGAFLLILFFGLLIVIYDFLKQFYKEHFT
jgi:hypothetical protein